MNDTEFMKNATGAALNGELGDKCGAAGELDYQQMSEIEPVPIRWLWPERIARGKVSMIAGNPGLGKSQLTLSMAATVTLGGEWPDGTSCEVGNVVILSAEDDPSDTLRPRLDAVGADTDKVFLIRSTIVGYTGSGDSTHRAFDLSLDLAALSETLRRINGAALVIIDPVSAYLGGVDSHRDAAVRALLSPLSDFAAESGAAVVTVSHLNKMRGGPNSAVMPSSGNVSCRSQLNPPSCNRQSSSSPAI